MKKPTYYSWDDQVRCRVATPECLFSKHHKQQISVFAERHPSRLVLYPECVGVPQIPDRATGLRLSDHENPTLGKRYGEVAKHVIEFDSAELPLPAPSSVLSP